VQYAKNGVVINSIYTHTNTLFQQTEASVFIYETQPIYVNHCTHNLRLLAINFLIIVHVQLPHTQKGLFG